MGVGQGVRWWRGRAWRSGGAVRGYFAASALLALAALAGILALGVGPAGDPFEYAGGDDPVAVMERELSTASTGHQGKTPSRTVFHFKKPLNKVAQKQKNLWRK